jgi:uncharacterized protein YprB with RNaseH-like and TPR domain
MSTLIIDLETVGFDTENQDALSPYKGQIISLALYDRERELGSVYFVSGNEGDSFEIDAFKCKARTEKELLEDFWETAKQYDVFVTFNGRAFDIPFLSIRSLAHDVAPTVDLPRQRFLTKQAHPYHVDLFDEFTFYGGVHRKPSLSVLCDAIGIDNPKLGMSGGDVTEAFLEKRMADIARYNAGDVTAISKLYEKWLANLAPHTFLNAIENF